MRFLRARGQQTNLAAGLRGAGLRQRQNGCPLILFHGHFPAADRTQLPALIVLAEFEPERSLGRLIEKNPKSFFVACDGADQGELR